VYLLWLAGLSLALLVIVIAVGYLKDVNIGVLSLGAALLVSQLGGLDGRDVMDGWPTSLFFLLLGVTFLFSIMRVNGSLQRITEHLIWRFRHRPAALLWLFFALSFALAAVGPGNIAVCAIMLPLALAVVSHPAHHNPLLVTAFVITGANMGGLSPLAPTGIIAIELARDLGILVGSSVFVHVFLLSLPLLMAYYLFLPKGALASGKLRIDPPKPMHRDHWLSMAALGFLVAAVMGYGLQVGIAAFGAAAFLLLATDVSERQVTALMPWGTLILISGVAVYTHVAASVGGIALLSQLLMALMGEATAASLLAVVAGLFSLVSSASGVAMPALFPTTPSLGADLPAVGTPLLMTAIVVGSHAVTLSPISTLGALALTALPLEERKKQFFVQLLLLAVASLALSALLLLAVSLYHIR